MPRLIEQELAAAVVALKTIPDSASNAEMAAAIGLTLDDFTFCELISLGEMRLAAQKYPQDFKHYYLAGLTPSSYLTRERVWVSKLP